MTKTYSVSDIANFLIQLSIESKKPLVRVHLQYMLYLINAQILIEDDAPLFTDSFEKWAFGPTVREIRDATTAFGSGPITKPIDTNTKNRIAKSFAKLIDFQVYELVDIILSQELYTKDKDAVMTYTAPNYKNSEIRQYFIDNPKEQLWQ